MIKKREQIYNKTKENKKMACHQNQMFENCSRFKNGTKKQKFQNPKKKKNK